MNTADTITPRHREETERRDELERLALQSQRDTIWCSRCGELYDYITVGSCTNCETHHLCHCPYCVSDWALWASRHPFYRDVPEVVRYHIFAMYAKYGMGRDECGRMALSEGRQTVTYHVMVDPLGDWVALRTTVEWGVGNRGPRIVGRLTERCDELESFQAVIDQESDGTSITAEAWSRYNPLRDYKWEYGGFCTNAAHEGGEPNSWCIGGCPPPF